MPGRTPSGLCASWKSRNHFSYTVMPSKLYRPVSIAKWPSPVHPFFSLWGQSVGYPKRLARYELRPARWMLFIASLEESNLPIFGTSLWSSKAIRSHSFISIGSSAIISIYWKPLYFNLGRKWLSPTLRICMSVCVGLSSLGWRQW